MSFCVCEKAKHHTVQLLRRRFYPATSEQPRSAATLNVLYRFQLESFEGKTNTFNFYHSLVRGTDNTGVSDIKDRYEGFRRMVQQFRHLCMLKHAGRGHHPEGVAGTQEGELALRCPACPQPGRNLPEDWENASSDTTLFLGINGNFRLKRKIVSNEENDPSLSKGWAYIVEEKAFKVHITGSTHEVETSTCSSYKAINEAETRKTTGLACTGQATVDCIRHDFKRAMSVADILKGESYINIDYPFFSGLRNTQIKNFIISYDIACQWHKKFWKRNDSIPPHLKLDSSKHTLKFLVPKFHLPAHIDKCRDDFSFNYSPKVGRTDGEAPERGWSNINGAANMTKEMGPGARRDTLDDFYGDWNWKKTTRFGANLLYRMKNAVPESTDHVHAHCLMEETLDPQTKATWMAEYAAWEADNMETNPFKLTQQTMTQDAVRRALNEAEEHDVAAGNLQMLHTTVSPCNVIMMGLDLEEAQRCLAVDSAALGPHATDRQHSLIAQRSKGLRTRICAWTEVQTVYCPPAHAKRAFEEAATPSGAPLVPAHALKLYLPSELDRAVSSHLPLAKYEWQLRVAQANDTLADIRANLHIQSAMYRHKDHYEQGQRAQTRSMTLLQRIQAQIDAATMRHRVAHKALQHLQQILRKDSTWQTTLKFLHDADVRVLSVRDVDNVARKDRNREVSWIWLSHRVASEAANDAVLHDSLRVEWCKSRARALRWCEEVYLIKEEMRRVLESLDWEAEWWLKQQTLRVGRPHSFNSYLHSPSPEHQEAIEAYAYRQADIRRSLRGHFAHTWRYIPRFLELFVPFESFGRFEPSST
ncbi:hypothetical protein HGRIS_010477 [Hohenbuehelia grisea]|uniref:CxC2-like cysteine cluster KDZ transposase-associated domain-containing protein n=1 Tax=Hohenbuehelia grisea TaxID=104357 RepID=A0ABR3IZ80_9AGAR